MPDEEITDYCILVEDSLKEQWYRIIASGTNGPGTTLHRVNVQTGYEPELISVPKFYPLLPTDNFTEKGLEIMNRLKNLVIFT